MLNENAKKWVAALRSGEFSQGRDRLQCLDRDGSYCCLGVACALYEREVGPLLADLSSHVSLRGPLDVVRNWLGLQNDNGFFAPGRSLASLNDSGTSFSEIADIIESEPEGLFVE